MASAPVGDETRTWRVGDRVEVLSLDEIMSTLDDDGALDGLPFMPEMADYCGRMLTVGKVAHKLCNTLSGEGGMRRMRDAVHLDDVRCDGSAHGGCQAACLVYWKTAWLRPADPAGGLEMGHDERTSGIPAVLSTSTRRFSQDDEPMYRCQATELLRAAPEPLPIRNLHQYVDDIRSRNASVSEVARAFVIGVYNRITGRFRSVLPQRLRHLLPNVWGSIQGKPGPTPSERTDLQPGERVRVRSRGEIAETLDEAGFNRGLGIDPEMARFCDGTFRVARRIEQIIDESSGRMIAMKQPCIVLEGVVCEGAYSANCPRLITPYWREIWLERIDPPSTDKPVSNVA